MNPHALEILQTLIEIPSVSDNMAAVNQAVGYVEEFLRARGMHVKRFEFNGVPSLVATTRLTKTPRVLLCGHVDVVHAEPELFRLQRKDGKLIGRGMVDMKAAVAAYLQVVDDLRDRLDQYDFGIMITADEETGGRNGVKKLVEKGYIPKVCILPDGGRDWALEVLAKGAWLFSAQVEGRSAHGSRPWEGESAIEKLFHLISEVKAVFPEQPGWNVSTCVISKLSAGEAINQVPAQASATFDIRLASIEDAKNISNAVNLILQAHDAKVKDEITNSPSVTDPENPHFKSFASSLEKVVGYPTGTTISAGGSDAHFFTAQGVPCIVFYPLGGGHHSPMEWIPEAAFGQLQQVFHDYLDKESRTNASAIARPSVVNV